MLRGKEAPQSQCPGQAVALLQMGIGGAGRHCLLEHVRGLGTLGRGLCPAVLCQQGENGFESLAG